MRYQPEWSADGKRIAFGDKDGKIWVVTLGDRKLIEIDVASETRYRSPVLDEKTLAIAISQSGETADTLAAMRKARERGATVMAITNVMGSQATRDSDGVLFTRAGLEIGVAATKTFLCQVAVMYLLALRLAELRGTLPPARLAELVGEVKRLPHCIDEVLAGVEEQVRPVAETYWESDFFLYIGRHVGLPVALEGALKLKEISYIATDAYAAGEMKHGPIALLSDNTPVVVVATESPVLDKVISNMQEVRARGANVIAIATESDETIAAHADDVIRVPATDWMLAPLLAVIPLSGWLYSSAAGVQVVYLGLIPLPDLVSKDKALADMLRTTHVTLNFTLLALVCIHGAAALKHHFVDRDAVLTRMLPRSRNP